MHGKQTSLSRFLSRSLPTHLIGIAVAVRQAIANGKARRCCVCRLLCICESLVNQDSNPGASLSTNVFATVTSAALGLISTNACTTVAATKLLTMHHQMLPRQLGIVSLSCALNPIP